MRASPICASLSARYVGPDRMDNCDRDGGLELLEYFAKAKFPVDARLSAFLIVQAIDRPPTEVDQIAAQGAKRFEEINVLESGKRDDERLSNSPVKSGVCLVKESPRGRRRLAHK